MRFTTAKKTFTERELDYFSRLDYKKHNGIGVVLDKPGYPGVGTSRYFVDAQDPSVAEWAVTVVDRFHGQGIGVTLFYAICVVGMLPFFDVVGGAQRNQTFEGGGESGESRRPELDRKVQLVRGVSGPVGVPCGGHSDSRRVLPERGAGNGDSEGAERGRPHGQRCAVRHAFGVEAYGRRGS